MIFFNLAIISRKLSANQKKRLNYILFVPDGIMEHV